MLDSPEQTSANVGAQEQPVPVFVLAQRARNAKSPRERHDAAYFAWETSLRLAVASRPLEDWRPLASGSIADWVATLDVAALPLEDAAMASALRLLLDACGDAPSQSATSLRTLLTTLPRYREALSTAERSDDFYENATSQLLAGLDALWSGGALWPTDGQLVWIAGIDVGDGGRPRIRAYELDGPEATLLDLSGVSVDDDLDPGRLYLRRGEEMQALYPWVLHQDVDGRERIMFFVGRRRGPEYLDYVSGEILHGPALLEAFPSIDEHLDLRLGSERAPAVSAEASRTMTGDRRWLGDYELLAKLGEGGMGIVYVARQHPLGRLVALKTLPPFFADDETALARFRREVHALALCEHPNVVKVYGAGFADGTHYYAMELIVGADLADVTREFAETDDFSVAVSTATQRIRSARAADFPTIPVATRQSAERLLGRTESRIDVLTQLFRDAARGVAHLHDQGIVHRDLKPSNLMVTESDRRLVVMDLGIAAVADAATKLTKEHGGRMGTLRYTAPEQLHRNAASADRRADVYSLGATFYELYAKRPMFDGDSDARFMQQLLRDEPAPLRRLERSVSVDLEVIVHKAVSKDHRERYDGASALADDLDALLTDRPIRARPPRLSYVLGRAVRRNASRLAALGLAALTTGIAIQWAREQHQESACERTGQRVYDVWSERRRAAAEEGLHSIEPSFGHDAAGTVIAIVDDYAKKWSELRTQACLDAETQDHWDEATRQRADWCFAEKLMFLEVLAASLANADTAMAVRAVEAATLLPSAQTCGVRGLVASAEEPPDDGRRVAMMSVLTRLAESDSAIEMARYADAVTGVERALAEAQALEWSAGAAESWLRLGKVYDATADHPKAEDALRSAYVASIASRDPAVAALAAAAMIAHLRTVGDNDGALFWARIGRATQPSCDDPRAPTCQPVLLARVLAEEGRTKQWTGAYDEAIEDHERALELQRASLGEAHPSVAVSHGNIAWVRHRKGEWSTALALHEAALRTLETSVGARHPLAANARNGIGQALIKLGRAPEALSNHLAALSIMVGVYGEEHPAVASMHASVSSSLAAGGETSKALSSAERALQIRDNTFGRNHPTVAHNLLQIAELQRALGETQKAEAAVGEALRIYTAVLGETHPETRRAAALSRP